VQRNGSRDDKKSARKDTGSTHTSDSSTQDQSGGIGGNAANEGAYFEYDESSQIDPFD